ncbi:hypothetical protein QQM79_20225 [Marinobacteraceae bacterium S3BR75-40.1]
MSDRLGHWLLEPEQELEGHLGAIATEGLDCFQAHGTHYQFHSEIKNDLDLKRQASGKFAANDSVLRLAVLVYNCLPLLGQWGMAGS